MKGFREPKLELVKPPLTETERDRLIHAWLPGAFEYYAGARHGSHYIDNGKDGYVFRMVNPNNPSDHTLDHVAVKVWEPTFRTRQGEIEMHTIASSFISDKFTVPKLYEADLERGFAMERIKGKTPHELLFKQPGTRIERGVYDDIVVAFRELNKLGLCHSDAHYRNYLLTDVITEQTPTYKIIIDAKVCIIDFGRSEQKNNPERDLAQIKLDLFSKVVDWDG